MSRPKEVVPFLSKIEKRRVKVRKLGVSEVRKLGFGYVICKAAHSWNL